MRKLGPTAAEELLEIVMRRYERASTLLTSNRPVEDWENYSATAPRSPPCSTVCSTTAILSNADRAAGGRRRMRLSTNITTSEWLVRTKPPRS